MDVPAATLIAAVQTEIQSLPKGRYRTRIAVEADIPVITTLAENYCSELVTCGWERIISGEQDMSAVLQEMPVIVETARGRPKAVVFQNYRPIQRPMCECTALSVDLSLSTPRKIQAMSFAIVPVWTALVKLGWETIHVSTITPDVLQITRLMTTDPEGITESVSGRNVKTEAKTFSVQIDMAKALPQMEKWLAN